jgi:NAD-dependent SIR2 family protein deacetylase
MNGLEENLHSAAIAVRNVEALVVTAGAGMGVDSGLPDFRGKEGFWKAYPPIAKLGLSFSEMADPHWFQADPRLAWAFYGHRLNLYRRTEPHRGFYQILELAQGKPGGCFVFTSNVDGQFQKAGFPDDNVQECHGSIHHLQCNALCGDRIWDAGDVEVAVDEEKFAALDPLPRCPDCGALARPNILMFGDWSWIPDRTSTQAARFNAWLKKLSWEGRKLVVIEVGAGPSIPTVRMRSEALVRDHGATLIRINPRDHGVPFGHYSFPLGGADGINRLYQRVKG